MINKQQKQHGFSLIELMIAMLIGILMLLAATGLFINNNRIYNEQNEMGRLQENARFAIDLLTNDIRMAGYAGCVDDLAAFTNTTVGAATITKLHNSTHAIEGINDKTAGDTWLPSGSTEEVTKIKNSPTTTVGTDAITLRYLEPIPNQLTFTIGSTMNTAANTAIPVTCSAASACTSFITANENMAISDCAAGDIFVATGATANTITHVGTFSRGYDDSAQISRYVTTRYYIGTAANTNQTGDAILALYRYTSVAGAATTQELLEGVERMEILYGVDTNDDGVPNSYLAAGAVGLTTTAHWGNVTSVKIVLLLRTLDENVNIDRDIRTYSLLDAAAYNPADERLRRRTYTTTVQIRNRAS